MTDTSNAPATILEIDERDDPDGARRLTLTGELDLASSPKLRERLDELHAARRTVRLDLSQLDFMDSTGIAILVHGHRQSTLDGWKLEVDSNVSGQIARLITITGIEPMLWPNRPPRAHRNKRNTLAATIENHTLREETRSDRSSLCS